MKFIKKHIVGLFNTREKLSILSGSFLIVGIFLYIITSLNDINPKIETTMETQRFIIGGTCLGIWFSSFPLINQSTKEKIVNQFIKAMAYLLFSTFVLFYWIKSMEYQKSHLCFDIIFSIALLFVIRYILTCIYSISKSIVFYIKKVDKILFSNNNSTGLKLFFERFTAILISISGTLGTILGIAKTFQALINIYK
jgi:hypothetical protein